MLKRLLPVFGVSLSMPLFLIASVRYPGGNDWDHTEPGFHFARNYVSALYQASAMNGALNAGRVFAVPAMLALCTCMAFMFWVISRRGHSPVTRKAIQICGIAAMVYTCLGVLTPMHDLLVLIAAAFFVAAVVAMIVSLHKTRQLWAVLGGLLCLSLLMALATMRHAILPLDLAPTTEWMLFVFTAVWVSFVYYVATAPGSALGDFRSTPGA